MSSYLVNMEIAQVYGFQYAIPVGIVLLCALLVFLFGFKKVEEPDFMKLSHGLNDDRKSKKKKKEKDRPKNQPNGSVDISKSSNSSGTRDDKKSAVQKEDKLAGSKDKKSEMKQDKNVLKESKKSIKQENKENIKSKQEKEIIKKDEAKGTVKAKAEKISKDAKKLPSAKNEKIIPLSSKENKKVIETPRTDQKVPIVKSSVSNADNSSGKSAHDSGKLAEKPGKKTSPPAVPTTQPSDKKKNTVKPVQTSTNNANSNDAKPYSEKNKENVNRGDWVQVGKKKKKDTPLIEKAPAGKASPVKKSAESTKSQDHVTKLDHVLQLVKNLEAEGIEIKCPEFEKEVEVFLSAQKKSGNADVQGELQANSSANPTINAVDGTVVDKGKNKKKNKKYQEAASLGGGSVAPSTSDLQIQELPNRNKVEAQKEVPKSSKVKSSAADHSALVAESEVKNVITSNKENIAFDELGDTWQETKVQKKRKKLRRDQ